MTENTDINYFDFDKFAEASDYAMRFSVLLNKRVRNIFKRLRVEKKKEMSELDALEHDFDIFVKRNNVEISDDEKNLFEIFVKISNFPYFNAVCVDEDKVCLEYEDLRTEEECELYLSRVFVEMSENELFENISKIVDKLFEAMKAENVHSKKNKMAKNLESLKNKKMLLEKEIAALEALS